MTSAIIDRHGKIWVQLIHLVEHRNGLPLNFCTPVSRCGYGFGFELRRLADQRISRKKSTGRWICIPQQMLPARANGETMCPQRWVLVCQGLQVVCISAMVNHIFKLSFVWKSKKKKTAEISWASYNVSKKVWICHYHFASMWVYCLQALGHFTWLQLMWNQSLTVAAHIATHALQACW